MSDPNKPYDQHYRSAAMRLAGVKAAQAWHHELAAAHLLHGQHPIEDQPVPEPETKRP